ncbi:EAL and modified HD-GYP domain-containing signal transduction protein [Kineothrix alysoides]|uniref:EAL and modified HD-GYP domain-containing signal transduction protein n=1 Tax=Kineothrix alysoides TaxID=1469948 RepID=A0A4R1QXX2_9FIRM|nr:EAL domain-containing protein [Kineothrix alysoides]TCL57214.1 EAL and modified HD-GYP domain-containing signal transduction protein [Kineothrix alysoides]
MFIARQPIFNKAMKIYGYELLFRSDSSAVSFGNASSVSATATVIGGLFEQGIDQIVGKAKAFVNFDYDFIMSNNIELIEPDTLIIEVLETVEVDAALIDRIKYLKREGYQIALDDFEESYVSYPIVPLADIIKYDIMVTPLDTITSDVKQALSQKKLLLAEKIETEEEFQKAISMGFHLFQGYFFCKPKIVGSSSPKRSSKVQYSMILNELKKEEPSYDTITEIIESDVNLAYRMMRVISHKKGESAFNSIKYALVRMGLIDLERWINILMLQDISQNKPLEIMRLSLVRSRFSEYVAENSIYKERKEEVSMMCLFSTLDVLLDQPMEEALKGMLISNDIFNALVHGKGKLKPFCRLMLSYEQGDWTAVQKYAQIIEIDTEILYKGYLESIQWSSKILTFFQ